jgi:hypothetical protein
MLRQKDGVLEISLCYMVRLVSKKKKKKVKNYWNPCMPLLRAPFHLESRKRNTNAKSRMAFLK